jgi:hypothetical protein
MTRLNLNNFQAAIDFIHSHTQVVCHIDNTVDSEDVFAMWPGISLRQGVIHLNPNITHLGDFLHEVGHIITVPKMLRNHMSGDLESNDAYQAAVFNYFSADLSQHQYHISDDDAATFWAYKACQTLEFDTRLPFERGYNGDGLLYHRLLKTALESHQTNRFIKNAMYAGISNQSGTIKTWDIANEH